MLDTVLILYRVTIYSILVRTGVKGLEGLDQSNDIILTIKFAADLQATVCSS